MPLSPLDKDRTLFHTGYTSASTAGAIQFGLAIPMQTLFLVESAFGTFPEIAIPRLQRLLGICDNIIFGKLVESQDYLVAARLGDMALTNSKESNARTGTMHPDLLRKEYVFYVELICDTLGVPKYPFSARFQKSSGAGNGRIIRS